MMIIVGLIVGVVIAMVVSSLTKGQCNSDSCEKDKKDCCNKDPK